MPSTITTIRRLSQTDLCSVCEFFLRINFPEYHVNFAPHPFTDQEAQRVCLYQGKDLYVGVFANGSSPRMVGYGMLRGLDEGYSIPSLGLCILKDFQGVGIGRMLLNQLLNESAGLGAKCVMLKVKKSNSIARGLYESKGFTFTDHDPETLIGFLKIGPD
jgi:ribosomal protein S18 acetylase RimI-like enzyme